MAVTPFGSSPVPPGFERRSHSSLAWVVRASVDDPALAHLLCDPETHLAHSPRIFKNEGRCVVALVGGYVMKRWSGYGGLERWKTRWRGTRAARAGWAATALEQAGVATVPVLAWGTREGVIGAPSYLLMAYLADAVDLRSWQGNRLEMAERLGGLIGLLHERGFTHRDLKPSNLLVTPDGCPLLIDLDGLRSVGPVPRSRAIADVVKLGRRMVAPSSLTPSEASRFLSRYCLARGFRGRRNWWTVLREEAGRHDEFRTLRAARKTRA